MSFFTLSGCPHGQEQSFTQLPSGAKINYGCSACPSEEKLYSTGFSGCQDCAYWRSDEGAAWISPYKRSVIDLECVPEEVIEEPEPDVDDKETEGEGEGEEAGETKTEETDEEGQEEVDDGDGTETQPDKGGEDQTSGESDTDTNRPSGEVVGIDDTIDSAIDNLIGGLVEDDQTVEDVTNAAKVAIPIVFSVLFVIACIIAVIMTTRGLCCSCCYENSTLSKYKKQGSDQTESTKSSSNNGK